MPSTMKAHRLLSALTMLQAVFNHKSAFGLSHDQQLKHKLTKYRGYQGKLEVGKVPHKDLKALHQVIELTNEDHRQTSSVLLLTPVVLTPAPMMRLISSQALCNHSSSLWLYQELLVD
jgi:hypothetical protein